MTLFFTQNPGTVCIDIWLMKPVWDDTKKVWTENPKTPMSWIYSVDIPAQGNYLGLTPEEITRLEKTKEGKKPLTLGKPLTASDLILSVQNLSTEELVKCRGLLEEQSKDMVPIEVFSGKVGIQVKQKAFFNVFPRTLGKGGVILAPDPVFVNNPEYPWWSLGHKIFDPAEKEALCNLLEIVMEFNKYVKHPGYANRPQGFIKKSTLYQLKSYLLRKIVKKKLFDGTLEVYKEIQGISKETKCKLYSLKFTLSGKEFLAHQRENSIKNDDLKNYIIGEREFSGSETIKEPVWEDLREKNLLLLWFIYSFSVQQGL